MANFREFTLEEDLDITIAKLESHMDSMLGSYKKNRDISHSLEQFTKELLNLNSLPAIIQYILENTKFLFELDMISLCLIDEKGEITKFLNEAGFEWDAYPGLILLSSNELIKSTFTASGSPYTGDYKGSKYSRFFATFKRKPTSIAVMLLNRRGSYLGAFNIGSYQPEWFSGKSVVSLLERMAAIINVCLENNLNAETIQRTSYVDALTGVNNRRFFEQRIDEELDRCGRHGEPVSCLFLDIDFFKAVNDTHGHHAGDLVLSKVAAAIKTQMRNNDVLARYGGEEFVVLLSSINEAMALDIAERIRATIEALRIELDDITLSVTISIGSVTYLPENGKLDKKSIASQLLKLSDAALYKAKNNGRNRVENGGVFSQLLNVSLQE